MSENNNISPEINQLIDEGQEIRKKKYEIEKNRVISQHEEMLRRKKELEQNANINITSMSKDRLAQIKKENREYLEHAKTSKCFISDEFQGKVPFFGRNIIFAAAKTGQGKTTIGKNVAYHTLIQGGKVLYITNEENTGDVYNGITALIKGWSYVKHESFTEEQLDEFDRMIDVLSQRMVVIDDNYNNGYGQTTTLEGVQSILMNLSESKIKYDVIIIDYYQNISRSNERSLLSNWQVQEEFAKFLDSFKNNYLAPIVILSQLKEGKDLEFKEAIEGRKMILNVATCALRVTAERDTSRTSFKIEKSRFTSAVGDTIYVGFHKGKYVDYNNKEFQQYANELELKRTREEQGHLLSKIKLGGSDDSRE